jgi:hypothetical protein
METLTLPPALRTPETAPKATHEVDRHTADTSHAKAVLNVGGGLNGMCDGWNQDEKDARRRIIQLCRSQAGNVITATLELVTKTSHFADKLRISCIWWEEKGECYITKADIMALLESLVGVCPSNEEKSRLSKLLEKNLRLVSVSETQSDSSRKFFKLIQEFSGPRPGNGKPVLRVFLWRNLTSALEELVSRYVSR